jgi:hypothetical protein
VLVDALAADACLDELLAASHKGQGTERVYELPTVETADGPQGGLEATDLAGWLPVLDVALLGVLRKRQN